MATFQGKWLGKYSQYLEHLGYIWANYNTFPNLNQETFLADVLTKPTFGGDKPGGTGRYILPKYMVGKSEQEQEKQIPTKRAASEKRASGNFSHSIKDEILHGRDFDHAQAGAIPFWPPTQLNEIGNVFFFVYQMVNHQVFSPELSTH